jgi:hypothetical protein
MSARIPIAAFAVALAVLTTAASGETVYRCGSSYSHAPCPGATTVDVGASPGAAERAEARAVAARERQLAAELVRDRHERERAARPAGAASLSPAPAASAPAHKTARATKKHRRDIDDRDFVAVVPTSTKK